MKWTSRLVVLLTGVMAAAFVAASPPSKSNSQSDEAKSHYGLAKQYLAAGERDKAVEELKAAIRLSPGFVEAHQDYLSSQRNKAQALVEEYESYVKQNPDSALYHYLLGKAYANARQPAKADAEYQNSLKLDPEFSWTLLELGASQLFKEREKAADFLEKARKGAGDSPALHATLASHLNTAQRYESALAEALRALELDSSRFEVYPIKWRARLNLASGSEKAQSEMLREIKDIETRYAKEVKALEAAYRGYTILFDDESAEKVKKAITEKDPKYFERTSGPRAMSMTPDGKEIVISGAHAELYFKAQQSKDSKETLDIYQKLEKEVEDPDVKLVFVYPGQAIAYVKLGDIENAERLLKMMETSGASSRLGMVKAELARAYVDRKIKLDTAQDWLASTIKANRDSLARYEKMENMEFAARTKDLLAEALYSQGRLFLAQNLTDKGIETLAESVKTAEKEATTLELGLLYQKQGKMDEAVKMLAAAYSFEGQRKQEAKDALERIYGGREAAKPLAALLGEAIEERKLRIREANAALGNTSTLEGKAAPAFELATVSGQRVKLSDLQGKVILLNFWATW